MDAYERRVRYGTGVFPPELDALKLQPVVTFTNTPEQPDDGDTLPDEADDTVPEGE